MELFYYDDTAYCYSSISVNTSLGINFYRTVNEEGSNGWAQVYARIPFDDYELSEKGALFGVVRGKPLDNWVEVEGEAMEWVDEFFNKLENGGDLSVFYISFLEKYPDIEGAWLWIVPKKSGGREIKVVRRGVSGVSFIRGETKYNLTTEEGKIVRGEIKEGDRLVLWSGKLGEMFLEDESQSFEEGKIMDYGNRLSESREAAAGLFFDFVKSDFHSTEDKREEEAPLLPAERENSLPSINMSKEDLAGDQLVGPTKAKEKVVNWWKRVVARKMDRVHTDQVGGEKRKKWAVLLGVIFLILLVVSLITGSIKIKADRETKRWREFSDPIVKNIEEAQGLVSINPSGARLLADEVKKTFEVQKNEFGKGKFKDEVIALETKINNAWVVTSGEKEAQFTEMLNIQLVRPGFVGSRLSLSETGLLLVVDEKMGTVVSADTATKNIKVVAGKGEGLGWLDVLGDGTRVMILTAKGVGINGKENGGVVFDSAVSNPLSIGRFGSNLYVLDSGNKEIYKYGSISDGFGDRIRWLQQDQKMSINPVDMAIDSDVWVLGDRGGVERFRRGVREQFFLTGVPEEIKTSRLAVQKEGDLLALLDSLRGMVILCSKETGVCEKQLKSEILKTATDIEFNGEDLLVLVPGKIGVLR